MIQNASHVKDPTPSILAPAAGKDIISPTETASKDAPKTVSFAQTKKHAPSACPVILFTLENRKRFARHAPLRVEPVPTGNRQIACLVELVFIFLARHALLARQIV